MRARRSSSSITLVLIGAAALYGCGSEESARRDIYRTRLDCQRDWGDDAEKCEPIRSGTHSGYYYGPRYRGDSRAATSPGTVSLPRQGSNAIGTAHVPRSAAAHSTGTSQSSGTTRGGFGASASAHSSGS